MQRGFAIVAALAASWVGAQQTSWNPGNTLFVHWVESLFHIDHWLLAYDIENRREVERRRVHPRDMLALKLR